MTIHVIIYTRPGCHLCDEAKEAMRAADCPAAYTLSEVNIESDRDLLERYQNDIPVIMIDGKEAFRHRVKPAEFKSQVLKR